MKSHTLITNAVELKQNVLVLFYVTNVMCTILILGHVSADSALVLENVSGVKQL